MYCIYHVFNRPHPNNYPAQAGASHAHAQPHPFMPVDTASSSANGGVEHEYHSIGGPVGVGVGADVCYRVGVLARTHPTPPQYPPPENGVNGTITLPPTDYR